MARRVELWLADVFPGETQIFEEYADLGPRELAIVSASVLDIALAELLTQRLVEYGNEGAQFLGLDGDGTAPCGAFGSRIQLALLVGVITRQDASILRSMKELRNLFAHRVKVSFLSPDVQKVMIRLIGMWKERMHSLPASPSQERYLLMIKNLERELATSELACMALLMLVFCTFQALFHRLHSRIERLDASLPKAKV